MIAASPRARRPRGGFTLVELIATIVILGTLGSVTTFIINTLAETLSTDATQAQLHMELAVALDRMAAEIRAVPRDESAAGLAPDIDAIDADFISFAGSEFSLVGTTLRYDDGSGAAVLLKDVDTLTLRALDETGTELPAPLLDDGCDDIRRIEITLSCTRHGVAVSLGTGVFVRSMAPDPS